MKTIQYKIITIITLLFTTIISAQKLEKKHTEKFNVDKDVTIDVNTRYTDIEIETWDKNEVVIEAYLSLNGETDSKAIDDYLDNWKFEALGNKSSIKISSKSTGLIDIHSFDFNSPDYEGLYRSDLQNTLENLQYVIPLLPEIPELPEMPELLFEHPEMPELPEVPEVPELPLIPTEFDFNAFKKDKSYLERWKKENNNIIGKNAKIKVGKNSISIDSSDDGYSYRWNITTEGQQQLAKEIEERLEEQKARREEHEKRLEIQMKERKAQMKQRKEELKERLKEISIERKLALAERQEAHERRAEELAKRRVEVKDILKKREKSKIKRVIKIKAPKDAKFNMNVSYGSMSFPN